MTSGGIFTLIANDGKADNLIYATKLLNTRIANIKEAKAGNDDDSPTLSEIEKTHMLFVNAHFKPFVMIGFEYMKSRPTTAGMKLNSTSTSILKYNIPQFGDFFSDMALNARIKNVKDESKYKYKTISPDSITWKVCTKFANGEEYVNFAISSNGSSDGTTTSAKYNNGSDYTYKTYSKASESMAFVKLADDQTSKYVVPAEMTASDAAVMIMTCFVDNINDMGATVEGQKYYPFKVTDYSSQYGWCSIENIASARAYISGFGAGSGSTPINIDFTGAEADERVQSGYMFYSGSADGVSTTGGSSPQDVPNTQIYSNATAGILEVKTSPNTTGFGRNQYVKIEYCSGYTDCEGESVPSQVEFAAGTKYAKQMRFCEFPGHRMIRDVKFTVNNNILDQYNTEVYNMYEKFYVKGEKKTGYHKLVGQQIPITATGEETAIGAQQQTTIVDGNQVPTSDMSGNHYFWVPLLFWFSKDFRLSIPSVSIPFGQRNIDVTLAPLKDIVSVVPAKVFKINKEDKCYSKKSEDSKEIIVFGNDSTVDFGDKQAKSSVITNISKIQVSNSDYEPTDSDKTITNEEIDVDLYINNLFVTPEIHDIFIKRVGFNLIRVHVQQEISITAKTNEILLSSLKWPIEYMLVGVKPNANTSDPDNYHKYETVETKFMPQRVSSASGDSVTYIKYNKATPILEQFGIKAHGVSLYDDTFAGKFYNAYLPYKYGSDIVTPKDDGVYMINFCLYPGDYQPSGHINVSRAREFYFKYKTVDSFDVQSQNATLHIIASAINFLLISDGSAVLRYTT
tara:strand:+ start:733 stop:3117 length:2385 start_codon:yes stop_codon:yes gene_type:complete